MSPTPLQWEVGCGQMRVYVQGGTESDELAENVDRLISPSADWPARLARKGLRRYTEWRSYIEGHGDKTPSSIHRQMVRYFVSQMEARITPDLQARRGHVPLTAPVIEIGFSINHVKRRREHRRHQNSNYLMNLAEVIFRHEYPNHFRLQQMVIFTCFQPTQCWFCEIVLTQLGQGYTEGAGGFSHYTAGRSNSGAYRKTSREEWLRFHRGALHSGKISHERMEFTAEVKRVTEAQQEEDVRKAQQEEALKDSLRAFNEVLDAELELILSLPRALRQGQDSS